MHNMVATSTVEANLNRSVNPVDSKSGRLVIVWNDYEGTDLVKGSESF